MRLLVAWLLACCWWSTAPAEGLSADRLGVVYNLDDASSRDVAQYYAARRGVPSANVIGIHLPRQDAMLPAEFAPVRDAVLNRLPAAVQSLVLLWSRPYAVGCMSITSAFAAGYRAGFCEPGCLPTAQSPLFDAAGWLPADTVGWWPAMLLPTEDPALAKALIQRGIDAESDGGSSGRTGYLVNTQDAARNVRAANYPATEKELSEQLALRELTTPVTHDVVDVIAYFTGTSQVEELARIHFRPGAVADHLTSTGGVLFGGRQMSVLAWIQQGATASYGTVTEPCNHLGKFPNPAVLLRHYTHGETVLEAYWKSVAMPGQGLFIGEPLARAFASRRR